MWKRIVYSLLSVFAAVLIIVASGLIFEPRLTDLTQAYDYVTNQILRDISLLTKPDIEPDLNIEQASQKETRKRLASIDPGVRLKTIRDIEEKSDPKFVPQLIKLLNDNKSIAINGQGENYQINQAARTALIKLFRDNVTREPGNIAMFIPLFEAGLHGSQEERNGVAQILSALRDPISFPLETVLTQRHATRSITPSSFAVSDYFLLNSRRVQFMYLLMVAGVIMGIAAIAGMLKLKSAKYGVICLLALTMNVGLGLLVHAELERGLISEKSLQKALKSMDLAALRSMCYSDSASYPGDSFFCQALVQSSSANTFRVLIALPEIEPDDLPYFKTNFQIRSQWIMSRIVALNLGKPILETIINSPDPEVSLAFIQTISQLRVQNDQIKLYLEKLTEYDRPEKVRKLAEKTLLEIKGRPDWSANIGRQD